MHNNDNLYPHLSLPPINAIVRSSNHQMQIFDTYRKIWIPLTPEEWVRQHILNYLIHSLNYPAGRLSIEFSFRYGKRMKRADAVFFSINKHPLVLVECKAPDRVLNQAVFSQIAAYAYVLKHLTFSSQTVCSTYSLKFKIKISYSIKLFLLIRSSIRYEIVFSCVFVNFVNCKSNCL